MIHVHGPWLNKRWSFKRVF